MKQRLLWAMDKLDLSQASREAWLAHLHFSTLPMTGLSDIGANFVPSLMGKWRATKKVLALRGPGEPVPTAVASLEVEIIPLAHVRQRSAAAKDKTSCTT